MNPQEKKEILCGYLPWGVYMKCEFNNLKLVVDYEDNDAGDNRVIRFAYALKKGYKPILYPLSDFRCEVTLVEVKQRLGLTHSETMQFFYFLSGEITKDELSTGLTRKLNKEKIDWHGWIDKGEAISVHSLNENPYL